MVIPFYRVFVRGAIKEMTFLLPIVRRKQSRFIIKKIHAHVKLLLASNEKNELVTIAMYKRY